MSTCLPVFLYKSTKNTELKRDRLEQSQYECEIEGDTNEEIKKGWKLRAREGQLHESMHYDARNQTESWCSANTLLKLPCVWMDRDMDDGS